MKAFVKILTIFVLISFLAGCAAPATPPPAAKEAPQPVATEAPQPAATEPPKPAATEAPKPAATEPPQPAATEAPVSLTPAEEWAKANGVGPYQPAEEDWAAIEAAAKQEGSVMVYANSSKIEKVLEPRSEERRVGKECRSR